MALQQVLTRYGFEFDKGKFNAIERGVQRNVKNLKVAQQRADSFQQKMGTFFARAKGVIGTYLGFRAIKTITLDYARGADAIAKFSAGLGISAKQYQRVTHAAALSGITVEELNMALPKLAKSAGDAADGSKSMATAFRRAGVDLKEGGKIKDPIRLLTEMADGMKNIKDEGRKTQILMNIFGRAGKKMGVLLDQGSEGIRKAMREADKLGVVLSAKQLKAAENFNDEMLRVKSVMIGIRNAIASRVLPVLTKQLRAFQMWWREGRNAENAMKALKLVAIFTSLVIGRMITGAVIKQVTFFVRGIWASVQAVRALGVAANLAALKVTAIFAAFILIGLIIEDLVAFAQGRDSVIGRLLGDSSLAKELRDALLNLAREAKKAWSEIGPALKQAWLDVQPALQTIKTEIGPLVGPAIRGGVKLLVGQIKAMAVALRITADLIKFQISSWKGFAIAAAAVIKVLSFIAKSMRDITHAATTAAAAIGAVTGRSKAGTALSAGVEAAQRAAQGVRGTFDSTGQQVATGLFQPAPALAFAAGTTATANVAPGAVQVNVTASGDPAAIARTVQAVTEKQIKKTFTNASRELKPPPRGQQ